MGYPSISLTGWQAGILTDSNYSQAKIQSIYPKRIWKELEENESSSGGWRRTSM